jgi:uncharacterized phage protein (TIGR02218 family)
MDAFRGGVPGMVIQPRCNYRLFEPNTCRLNKDDFDVAVTIDAMDGRTVTVAGAGLTGLAENHFAEGWIQTGTEDQFEVRTILVSGAEASGQVVLMLNAPLSFAAVGAAATVYPGCDGRDTTCSGKFNNFVNWGGHRVPLRNLTLKALEISPGSGGKK